MINNGYVVGILRVSTKRGGDDETNRRRIHRDTLRNFSAAPTKLQSNYHNAQQEIIVHHPARRFRLSALVLNNQQQRFFGYFFLIRAVPDIHVTEIQKRRGLQDD